MNCKVKYEYNMVYDFFESVFFYIFCPESMQTVSLCEKIISLSAQLMRLDFVQRFFGNQRMLEMPDLKRWFYLDLLDSLKENARSNEVKTYLGL